MRLMKSGLTSDVTVQNRTASVSVTIPPGAVVDVDLVIDEGVTVGDALGDLIGSFTDEAPPAKAESRRRTATPATSEDKE